MLKLSFYCFRSEEKPLIPDCVTLPLLLEVNSGEIHLPSSVSLLRGCDVPQLIITHAGFLSAGFLVRVLQKPSDPFKAGKKKICSFLIRNAEYASLATSNHIPICLPTSVLGCPLVCTAVAPVAAQ